jgi:hypothetical protein
MTLVPTSPLVICATTKFVVGILQSPRYAPNHRLKPFVIEILDRDIAKRLLAIKALYPLLTSHKARLHL